MDIAGVTNGVIIGFKYFGFGGLDNDTKGVKAFAGAKPGNGTKINVYLTPTYTEAFKIHVMLDGPYANSTWNGKEIAVIDVPSNAARTPICCTADVARFVEGLSGKHAIYLVAEGPEIPAPQFPGRPNNNNRQVRPRGLFDLHGIGFSSNSVAIQRQVPPTVQIQVDGKDIVMPTEPIRSTGLNGYTDQSHYQAYGPVNDGSVIRVLTSDPEIQCEISRIEWGRATVKCTYRGQTKTYLIN